MKKILYSMLVFAMASLTFTSCEDVPAPYDIPTGGGDTPGSTEVAEGDGTEANPFNAVAANAFVKAGEGLDSKVYIKGVISQVKECSPQYGNATFYITEDGSTNKTSFYVFQVKGLGNNKIAAEDEVKVGDAVVVYAQLTDYNGTYETLKGTGYIYSLNGKTSGGDTPTPGVATGDGTKDNPFNSVAANAYASKLGKDEVSTEDVYIKGKVVSVKSQYSTQWGNATFYISDDGTAANQFCVFQALYLNNVAYTEGPTLAPGDDVVVCGKVTNYYGNTPETMKQQAYLVSLKSNGGSEPGGDDKPATSEGVTISGNTLTLTNAAVTAGDESITVNAEDFGVADADKTGEALTTVTLSDGTTLTFDNNGETNGAKYFSKYKMVRVYKNNKVTVTGKKAIAKIEFDCDIYGGTTYVGNETATLSVSGNSMVYNNVFTGTSGGGVQLRFKSIKITYAK